METKDEMVMIPLICKENSDQRFLKIIKLLVIILIASNLAWAGSWGAYWLSPTSNEVVSVESNNTGNANYIEEKGDIINGENSR